MCDRDQCLDRALVLAGQEVRQARQVQQLDGVWIARERLLEERQRAQRAVLLQPDLREIAPRGRVAGVRVVRPGAEASSRTQTHNTELCFFYVLSGQLDVVVEGERHTLASDASVTIPGNARYAFERYSKDLQLLEITLPETFLIGD